MPRITDGNTILGNDLNRISSKQDGQQSSRYKWKLGRIIGFPESFDDTAKQAFYYYRIQIYNISGGKLFEDNIVSMKLAEHSSVLAQNYGPPESLINSWVKILYRGSSVKNGTVALINNIYDNPEETIKSNEQQITGAAFAPPGGALV